MMLKIVLVAHLTYENQWGKLCTKIQTFVFWDTLIIILQKLFLKLFDFAEWVCHGPVLAVKVIIIFVENDNRRFLLRTVEVKSDCVFCFTEIGVNIYKSLSSVKDKKGY